jgi:hypothetical protein
MSSEFDYAAQAAAQRQRNLDTESARAILAAAQPAWAKALIVAELHEDVSDSQSDYFSSRRTQTVALAWSKHERDLFPELRKAAATFEPAAHLATASADAEHREKYSMGHGFYLGADRYSGWHVRKTALNNVDHDTDISRLVVSERRSEANTPRSEAGPERRSAHLASVPTPQEAVDRADALFAANQTRLRAMATTDIQGDLRALLDRWMAYHPGLTETHAMGELLANFFEFEGGMVLRVAQAALTAANFRPEATVVGALADKVEQV